MLKTEKTDLTTKEIESYIQDYQAGDVKRYTRLWQYFKAKNPTILERKESDPDNRTPFGYGRKIVKTFTGYAYRPGYVNNKRGKDTPEDYYKAIEKVYQENNEPLKTERAGRNTGIFGVAYELHYIDGMTEPGTLTAQARPRFYPVDPREMILIYDRQPEPKKAMAIRFYPVAEKEYRVEFYTKDKTRQYKRVQEDNGDWEYALLAEGPNFYQDIPVTPYYIGDDGLGLIDPVAPIIDDFDIINSDSMIEFSRFANAYLRVVGGTIGDPTGQNPKLLRAMLAQLKQSRVFDRLKDKDDVTFLTKDIPKDFVEYMNKNLKEQIHTQSHVPDFTSEAFRGALSGAAIQRMLFDFENVVSDAEADFDIGLYDRMGLITKILTITKAGTGDPKSIDITHRRNLPIDRKDAAETAASMRDAGFSMLTVVENMPNEMIPDDDEEMKRQQEEKDSMVDLDALAKLVYRPNAPRA